MVGYGFLGCNLRTLGVYIKGGVIAPNKDGFQIIQMCDTVPGHKFSLDSVWFCLQGAENCRDRKFGGLGGKPLHSASFGRLASEPTCS